MKDKGTPTIVTTKHRGVFFGYLVTRMDEGRTVVLGRPRMCVYWHKSVNGILGLAVDGPNSQCRVTPSADGVVSRIVDVTSETTCTAEAAEAWECGPWKL